MRYEPSLPAHNDNVSHEKPGREFITLVLGLCALAAALFFLLGLVVDAGIEHMSDATEAKIVGALAFKAEGAAPIAPASASQPQALLQALAAELAPCAALPYPVRLRYVESKQANAVALPGGDIVVFSELLDKVASRNGLAFVLAHELGHLKNRDHLRGLGRSLILIGMAAAVSGAQSDLTQLFTPATEAGMARYSQARESAADERALTILNCRYGHVGGATEFFEAMQKDAGAQPLPHFLSSHPQLQARIARIRQLSAQRGFASGPLLPLGR